MQERKANPTEQAPRVEWVDSFKGIAIVLVVIGHVIGGLRTSGILSDSSRFLYRWIYAFHMPALFFASGLFARRSLGEGFARFLGKKLQRIAYPYFVWGLLTWACQMLMSDYMNTRPDPWGPLRLFYCPEAGPWFLYILLVIFLVFAAVTRLRISRSGFVAISGVVYALGIAGVFSFWSALDKTSEFLMYFALGAAVGRESQQLAGRGSMRWLAVLALGSLILLSALVWLGLDEIRTARPLPALAGIVALYALSCGLAQAGRSTFFRLCGVMSLEIYVLHPFPSVLGRAVLLRGCGIHAAWPHVAVGVTLGVCGPLAVAWLCRRFDFPYLFRWGKGRPRHALLATAT